MSGLDYFIGNNFGYAQGREQAIAEADANIAEAQAIIDAQAAENRRLMQRLRDLDERLAEQRFKRNLSAIRATELYNELQRRDPKCPLLTPAARAESRRRAAASLLADESYGFKGYVYDEDADTLTPRRR
jgi:hypothetical protein